MTDEARCPACYELVSFHDVLDTEVCPQCGLGLDTLFTVATAEERRLKPDDEPRYPVEP